MTDDIDDINEDEPPASGPAFIISEVFTDEMPDLTTNYVTVVPVASDEISENVTPGDQPTFKEEPKPPTHDQITRRGLALVVLIPTVIFYAAVLASLIFHWVDRDELTALVAAISPFQTLAAAVVGFYFAKKDDGRG